MNVCATCLMPKDECQCEKFIGVRMVPREIPTDHLSVDPCNVRKEIGDIDDLCDSIKEQGILQPLTVRAHGKDHYFIIIGSRRHAAAQKLGVETVPCLVVAVDDKTALTISLEENLQRNNLTDYEEIAAVRRVQLTLRDEGKEGSEREIAKQIHKDHIWVHRILVAGNFLEAVSEGAAAPGQQQLNIVGGIHGIEAIAKVAHVLFPKNKKRQHEVLEVLKDKSRDDIERIGKALQEHAATTPIGGDLSQLVKEIEEAQTAFVEVSMAFDPQLSKAILNAVEKLQTSKEDVVMRAVVAWLRQEKYL